MPCYEETEMGNILNKASGILDEMLKIAKEQNGSK